MSSYRVIRTVGEALRTVLLDAFEQDEHIKAIIDAGVPADTPEEQKTIILAPPVTASGDATRQLSLWLYLISENEYVKNRPPTVQPDGNIRPAPLALSLFYLVTPGTPELQDDEQQVFKEEILGKTLEVFSSHPILALVNPDENIAEELHLSLCRMTLEDITRVWESLQQPYRLSVCYRVNIARIESTRISRGALVLERQFDAGVLRRAA